MTDSAPFLFPIRVYYADTDAGGIVYHARYLEFAERCRSELLRAVGHPLVTAEGTQFVVTKSQIEWHAPALLDDLLTCRTTVEAVKGARVHLIHEILRGAELLTTLRVELAHLSADRRPVRLPADLMAAMRRFSRPAAS